jgi:hypothetical protein
MALTNETTAAITAQNTGTDWVKARKGDTLEVAVGTGGGATTITLQRRLNTDAVADGGSGGDGTVHDVKTYSPAAEPEIVEVQGDWEYRLFVKTGEFGTGTANLYIWKT